MTRPHGTACAPCRRFKTRCVFSGAAANRCDRCLRVGRQCVSDHRRRPATKHDGQIGSRSSGANASLPCATKPIEQVDDLNSLSHDLQRELASRSRRSRSVGNAGRPLTRHSLTVSPLDCDTPARVSSPDAIASNDAAGFTPPAFVSFSEDARNLALDTALDSRSLDSSLGSEKADSQSESRDTTLQQDPIHVNLLNRPSAQHLYDGYFTHFEYNVGFLDPALYTFEYTRKRSSFLFTVLLLISSRVFRPVLTPGLRAHAEFLLAKALLSCESKIESVWAIICMYYWKEPGDTRGYSLIGFAMRLAMGSDWHGRHRSAYTRYDENTIRRTKGLTENGARQLRDQDRIWLWLGSLERTLSFFTERPLVTIDVAPDLGSRSWLRSRNSWTYPFGDARAMAGHELTVITQPVHDYACSTRRVDRKQGSYSDHESELFTAIQILNKNLISWYEHWVPAFASYQVSPSKDLAMQPQLYANQIRTHFNSILLHRILESTANCVTTDKALDAIRSCYTTALGSLQAAVKFGQMGILYYLWDTAHLMIAYAAMVLLKLFKLAPSCPGVSVHEAYNVMKEAAEFHISAARSLMSETNYQADHPYTTPAATTVEAQARLLYSILRQIKADITPVSVPHVVPSTESNRRGDQQYNNHISPTMMHNASADYCQARLPARVGDIAVPANYTSDARAPSVEAEQVDEMTDEMEIPLDNAFMEQCFTQAGLLHWDEPGMFKEPR